MLINEGCPYVTRARNSIVNAFLDETDADALLFIDTDVSWPPCYIEKLADSGKQVVAGPYPKRDPYKLDYPIIVHADRRGKREGDLLEVVAAATGFLMIHREVFLKMREEYGRTNVFYEIHDPPGVDFGEDYLFCLEWTKMGGKVWVDTSMKINHHDGVFTATGDFLEWVEKQYNVA
jgi:glycosyltransferase involved in cell wall biosynthesis